MLWTFWREWCHPTPPPGPAPLKDTIQWIRVVVSMPIQVLKIPPILEEYRRVCKSVHRWIPLNDYLIYYTDKELHKHVQCYAAFVMVVMVVMGNV